MRSLAVCLSLAAASGTAFAQEAPPPADAPPAAASPPAPAADPAAPAAGATTEAAPAATGLAEQIVEEKGKEDDRFPLHVSASMAQNVGSGTFFYETDLPDGYDETNRGLRLANPTFFTTFELTPSLVLGDFTFAATQSLALEWTQSDSTTYANQLEVADTRFSVRWGALRLDEQGLSLSLSAGYNLPISPTSRWYGSIGSFGAGARGAWTWKDVGLTLSTGANAGYNVLVPAFGGQSAPRPYVDRVFGVTNSPTCLPRGGEDQYLACVGEGPAARTAVSFGASWTTLENQLTLASELAVSYATDNYWAPVDDKTSQHAIGGEAFFPGWSGTLSVSYTPVEWFTLTAGSAASQPMLGRVVFADDQAHEWNPRWPTFPFWDFSGNAKYNTSTLFIDTTFAL